MAALFALLAATCVPLAAMPSSSALSTVSTAADSAARAGSDTLITTRIQAHLMVRRDIEFTDIDVWTTDGVVRLSGVLDSPAQVRKAVAVARNVRGVRAVDASALSAHAE